MIMCVSMYVRGMVQIIQQSIERGIECMYVMSQVLKIWQIPSFCPFVS